MNYVVVIVTYNRLPLLKECLKQIDAQSLKFNEMVVVNNCSTDGTAEFLHEYAKHRNDITIITTKQNLGGSGGFELGIRSVPDKADYVLLIDDDAILHKNFLEEIDSHREDGIYGYSGTVLTDGSIDTSHRRRLADPIFMLKTDVPAREYNKETFLYDLSSFCGLGVSRKLIDQIGFPRGDYFIWYDDTEYSLRIRNFSKIKNINRAWIFHKALKNKDGLLSWKSYYGYRNQIHIGKHYSKCPWLYKKYRYMYHTYKILYYHMLAKVKKIQKKNNNDYMAWEELHRDVLHDSKQNILGINKKYVPGKRAKEKNNAAKD